MDLKVRKEIINKVCQVPKVTLWLRVHRPVGKTGRVKLERRGKEGLSFSSIGLRATKRLGESKNRRRLLCCEGETG